MQEGNDYIRMQPLHSYNHLKVEFGGMWDEGGGTRIRCVVVGGGVVVVGRGCGKRDQDWGQLLDKFAVGGCKGRHVHNLHYTLLCIAGHMAIASLHPTVYDIRTT